MQARRLLSFLLVLMLAIPGAAFATEGLAFQRYIIQYQGMDASGQLTTLEAVEGQDFIVQYADDAEMRPWFMMLHDFPLNAVLVAAEYWDGAGFQLYTYFDPLTGSEWLDLSNSVAIPPSVFLRASDGSIVDSVAGKQITFSMDPAPVGGQQFLPENGGYADPNAGGDFGNDPNAGGDINADPNAGGDFGNDPNAGGDINADPNAGGDFGNDLNAGGDFIPDSNANFQAMSANAFGAAEAQGGYQSLQEETLPPIDQRSGIGEVLQSDTLLYAAPGQPLGTALTMGTYVNFDEALPNSTILDNGTLWCLVTTPDSANPGVTLQGYLPLSTFRFLTPQEAEVYTQNLMAQQMPAVESVQGYLSIQSANTAMYGRPNDMSTIVATLPKDSVVTFLSNVATPAVLDAGGKLWLFAEIMVNGVSQRGYVPVANVKPMTQAEANLHDKPMEELVAHETNHAAISQGADMVNPSTGKSVMSLNQGDVVEFLTDDPNRLYMDSNKDLWLYARYTNPTTGETKTGYVKQSAISFMTTAQRDTYIDSLKPAQTPVTRDSDYAYVAANNTAMVNPSTGQTIATLSKDTVVKFEPQSATPYYTAQDKTLWMYVSATNAATGEVKTGYIQMNGLQFMSASQEKTHLDSLKPSPSPSASDKVVEPTPIPSPTLPSEESRYAWVLGTNVNIRRTPSSNGEKTGATVTLNEVVLVTGQATDPQTKMVWYVVELIDKRTGYIRSDYVKLMTPEEHMAYVRSLPTPTPSPVPSTVPATAKPTQVAPAINGYMMAVANNVPVLSWPNVGALPVAALSYGTVVYTQEQRYDDAGTTLWAYARYNDNNNWGYIPSAYLQVMTPAQIEAYFQRRIPTTPPVAPTYSPSTFSGYALLTKDQVNFRNAANATATVLGRLRQGTIVRVVFETANGGYTWYRCESGGTTGYIRGDMVSMLTVSEYQKLMTAASYSSSSGQVITPTATANLGGVSATTWTGQQAGAKSTIAFITIPPLSTVSPSPSADPSASPSIGPSASPTASDGAFPGLVTASPDPNATLPPPTSSPEFPTENTGGFSPPGLLLALVVLLILAAGGFYGYSVYNKARRKQAQAQATRLAAEARQKEMGQTGARSAVRRPMPPTQPGGPQNGSGSGPQQPGGQQQPRGPQPGQPGSGQAGQPMVNRNSPYAKPGQPGQPGQPPKTQDVISNMPRAQVDGRPVEGAKPGDGRPAGAPPQGQGQTRPPVNPYARPQTPPLQRPQPTQAGPGAPTGQGTGKAPPAGAAQRPQFRDNDDLDRPLTQQRPMRPIQPAPIQEPAKQPLPQAPAGAMGGTNGGQPARQPQQQNTYASPYAPPLGEQRPRMPVAPPPVEPDAPEPSSPTARRRRRRVEEEGGQDEE